MLRRVDLEVRANLAGQEDKPTLLVEVQLVHHVRTDVNVPEGANETSIRVVQLNPILLLVENQPTSVAVANDQSPPDGLKYGEVLQRSIDDEETVVERYLVDGRVAEERPAVVVRSIDLQLLGQSVRVVRQMVERVERGDRYGADERRQAADGIDLEQTIGGRRGVDPVGGVETAAVRGQRLTKTGCEAGQRDGASRTQADLVLEGVVSVDGKHFDVVPADVADVELIVEVRRQSEEMRLGRRGRDKANDRDRYQPVPVFAAWICSYKIIL